MRIRVAPASQFHPSSWNGRLFPIVAAVAGSLFAAGPANAHHLMDGRTPKDGWEGFLSGFAHPVIGLDHLAFIIAIGLLSAVARPGLLLVVGLVLATMGGTAIHLIGFAMPGLEFIISASVCFSESCWESNVLHAIGSFSASLRSSEFFTGMPTERRFWRRNPTPHRLPVRLWVRPVGDWRRGLRRRKDRAPESGRERTVRRTLEAGGSGHLRDRSRPSVLASARRPLDYAKLSTAHLSCKRRTPPWLLCCAENLEQMPK